LGKTQGRGRDAIAIATGVSHCNRVRATASRSGPTRTDDPRIYVPEKTDERPESLQNIKNVPLPETDPVHGGEGRSRPMARQQLILGGRR
jgi:uncharacterized protein YjlB